MQCGNVRYCRSADLMMVCGGGVDPLKLKFYCNRCKPDIKITLLEVHPEHLPKKLMIHKPMKIGGRAPGTRNVFVDSDRLTVRSADQPGAGRQGRQDGGGA
ncbi:MULTISPECIES: hypothetical protein [unclassified Mesorhizobium]|uniref:hypothetical protein n=1 Tax=unclassified Mesorhizobium TaxID=325217 RepID=UPI001FE06278|nr:MULTISPECIES: hypothetical protein [unclassified Mesorhizobium]